MILVPCYLWNPSGAVNVPGHCLVQVLHPAPTSPGAVVSSPPPRIAFHPISSTLSSQWCFITETQLPHCHFYNFQSLWNKAQTLWHLMPALQDLASPTSISQTRPHPFNQWCRRSSCFCLLLTGYARSSGLPLHILVSLAAWCRTPAGPSWYSSGWHFSPPKDALKEWPMRTRVRKSP